MASKKYYGGSLSGAIITACQQNLPPESLVIISNTRFDSLENMLEVYGPREDGWGRWTAEEAAYASRVWEEGSIIQPRMHLHADFEISGFSRRIVGFSEGAAAIGTDEDVCVGISRSYTDLHSDITRLINEDKDAQLIQALQKIKQLDEFQDENGNVINIEKYKELHADELKYKYVLDKDEIIFSYKGTPEDSLHEIRVPDGVTKVDISGPYVVFLSDNVKRVRGDVDIIVCTNDEQRDLLNSNFNAFTKAVIMSQDEYDRFLTSSFSNAGDFIRSEGNLFTHNENHEINGIRREFINDLAHLEIPEGEKIDFRNIAYSLHKCDSLVSVVEGDTTFDKNGWLRSHDPEPLIISQDGTTFLGVKKHYLDNETITIPACIDKLDILRLDEVGSNIKTVIIENPNIELPLPDRDYPISKYLSNITVAIGDSGPQNILDAVRERNCGFTFDSSGYLSMRHPLYNDSTIISLPEGARHAELAGMSYETIYLPSSYERINNGILTDNLKTIVIDENTEKIRVNSLAILDRDEPLTIVCTEKIRQQVIEQFAEYADENGMKKISIISHNDFSKDIISSDSKYPIIEGIDKNGDVAQFIDNKALCYEEKDGIAKISFENGDGIYLNDKMLVTYETIDGKEVFVGSINSEDKVISSDELLRIFEGVEKDGAKTTSLDVANASESDNSADNNGFALGED